MFGENGLGVSLINSLKNSVNKDRKPFETHNEERKVVNRKEKEKKRVGYKEFAREFKKENNELNICYTDKIFCADSLQKLKELPDNCIDLIFTSPPYNFGLDYQGEYNDTTKWKDYFDKLFLIFNECIRVLKYSGRIIINIQPLFSDYIPSHHLVSSFFIEKGLIWKGEILWEKNNYNCKYTAWGSWKSPSSPYLKYTWEFLEIFCKGDLKKESDGKKTDLTEEEFKKWVVGKWSIAPERKMKEYGHPAMFPEELAKRVIKLFSFQDDIILDPFNGAGTTTYIAKDLNRKYVGIDISEEYCEIAKERIKKLEDRLL
jgi:DNA modification methylase